MTTDLYAKCPCGSGKKIKFCCKDIIGDIERLERMLKGEQRTAALDKVNKLLEKHPNRPALLSMKAQVYLELQQVDNAAETTQQLLAAEPENLSALAMNSLVTGMQGDLRESQQQLHLALRLSDGVVSQLIYRAFLTLCYQLIRNNEIISAYAHLMTLVSITKGQDRSVVQMLMQVSASERLPAIFHGLMVSGECPDDKTWKREFDLAMAMYMQGDWSGAAKALDAMSLRILDEPQLLRNQAILQTWTCQTEKAAKSFRYYAAIRDLDLHKAVEAEACAQVLAEPDSSDILDLVAITAEIDDASAMMEKLLSADVIEAMPVQRDPDTDTPPPKGQFVVFDRAVPKAPAEGAEPQPGADAPPLDQLPREVGSLTLFGKETDKNARLVIVLLKDDQFEESIKRTGEIAGVTFDAEKSDTVGSIHKVEKMFRPNFRPVPGTMMDTMVVYQQEWISNQLQNVWPTLTFSEFGGKCAKEAAGERKYQRSVLAAILNMEFWADRQPFKFDFDQLRASLGLPVSEPIDPADVNVRSLTPTQLRCLQLEKVTDEDLRYIFEILSIRPNGRLLYKVCQEMLQRPSIKDVEGVDLVELHDRLSELATTTDEQLEHLSKARDLAVSEGESPATWLVRELDLRLLRAEGDQAKRLVTEIQERYMREPGVAQLFSEVLSKYGLMPRGQAPPAAEAAAVPQAVGAVGGGQPTGGVWTPEGGAPDAPPTEGGEEKSKLWLPD